MKVNKIEKFHVIQKIVTWSIIEKQFYVYIRDTTTKATTIKKIDENRKLNVLSI